MSQVERIWPLLGSWVVLFWHLVLQVAKPSWRLCQDHGWTLELRVVVSLENSASVEEVCDLLVLSCGLGHPDILRDFLAIISTAPLLLSSADLLDKEAAQALSFLR